MKEDRLGRSTPRESTDEYREGLQGIAARNGISIPEALFVALKDLRDNRGMRGPEIPTALAAAQSLDPGAIYTAGLWEIAQTTERLREVAQQETREMALLDQEEHIEPTQMAFTWHTGEEL